MSIAFNKKDYRVYDSDDDSNDNSDDDQDVEIVSSSRSNPIPADWVDNLCMDLKYMADRKGIHIFENLNSVDLALFASQYSDYTFKN